MGIFDALSRKSTIDEPVEAGQWRALGVRATRVVDLFVLRPQSESAKRFLKNISSLRGRIETEADTTTRLEVAAENLEAISAEFAISQRKEVETLIDELGTAVAETLEKFATSIDAAGRPISGMDAVRKGLTEAQKAQGLDEVRKLLAQSVTGLQKLAEEQADREKSLRAEYQAHSKRLSAFLVKAQEEGRTDALTALANRRAYNEHMDEVMAELRKEKGVRCLCLMDLDGFKAMNDTFGHAAGDQALITFGSRLRRAVGNRAFVARLGGDEFLVEGDFSRTMLEGMLIKLTNNCGEHPCFHEDRRMTIRFSYGISEYDGSHEEPVVRKRADEALYAFKVARKANRAA